MNLKMEDTEGEKTAAKANTLHVFSFRYAFVFAMPKALLINFLSGCFLSLLGCIIIHIFDLVTFSFFLRLGNLVVSWAGWVRPN